MQHTIDLCCVTHCTYLQENEHMYAIRPRTVGSVLAPYDTDQRYPCFGFGAKLSPYNYQLHCFENDSEVTELLVTRLDRAA